MEEFVKIVELLNGQLCIAAINDDWREGEAVDLIKREIIYYNGDYNDVRPPHIKKLIASGNEIGWVRHLTEGSAFVSKFEEVKSIVLPKLYYSNGNCLLEKKKIEGKYVIKLI